MLPPSRNSGQDWFDELTPRAQRMLLQARNTVDSLDGEVSLLSALAQETYRRALALSEDALEGNTSLVTLGDVNKAFDTAVKAGSAAVKAKVERLNMLQDNEDPETLITPINVDFTVVSVPKSIERRRVEAIGVEVQASDYAEEGDGLEEHPQSVHPSDAPPPRREAPPERPQMTGRGRGRGRV